jgi:glyoxylase-like metal-dependent hydrolase (beta-lactamase superfamily II)
VTEIEKELSRENPLFRDGTSRDDVVGRWTTVMRKELRLLYEQVVTSHGNGKPDEDARARRHHGHRRAGASLLGLRCRTTGSRWVL